jgi:hypothetical protein
MATHSVTHRNLIRGTIAAAGATVIFYMGSVNWSETLSQGNQNSALSAYLLAVSAALVPYGILVSLLERAKQSTIFQVTLFSLVIALPIICFSYWRVNNINTGGWDYFVIPFWQVVLLMVLNGLCKFFVPLAESHKLEPESKNDP